MTFEHRSEGRERMRGSEPCSIWGKKSKQKKENVQKPWGSNKLKRVGGIVRRPVWLKGMDEGKVLGSGVSE